VGVKGEYVALITAADVLSHADLDKQAKHYAAALCRGLRYGLVVTKQSVYPDEALRLNVFLKGLASECARQHGEFPAVLILDGVGHNLPSLEVMPLLASVQGSGTFCLHLYTRILGHLGINSAQEWSELCALSTVMLLHSYIFRFGDFENKIGALYAIANPTLREMASRSAPAYVEHVLVSDQTGSGTGWQNRNWHLKTNWVR
jgi:hypothetical protein